MIIDINKKIFNYLSNLQDKDDSLVRVWYFSVSSFSFSLTLYHPELIHQLSGSFPLVHCRSEQTRGKLPNRLYQVFLLRCHDLLNACWNPVVSCNLPCPTLLLAHVHFVPFVCSLEPTLPSIGHQWTALPKLSCAFFLYEACTKDVGYCFIHLVTRPARGIVLSVINFCLYVISSYCLVLDSDN